jgi:hypothetical protein
MMFPPLRYSPRYCLIAFLLVHSLYVCSVYAQELESAAIYVGPFDVTPTLNLNVENNDNVFLEQNGNETSATLTTLAPQVSAVAGDEVMRYELVYRLENGLYSGVDNTDYTDHKLDVNIGWRPDIRHLIELGVSESRGHDERSIDSVSGLNANELDKTKEKELSADYTFGSEGAKGRLIIGFKTNSLRYTTNQATTNVLESDTNTANARFSVAVGASTRALVEVTNAKNTFHANETNNRQDRSYAIGVEWELSDLIKSAIRVGRSNNDLLNAVGDTSSSIGQASITWSPLEYSVLTLTANKSTANTENNIGSFVDRSRVELGWAYKVNDRLTASTSIGRQRDNFINANRKDTTNDSQVQLSYAFRRWLSVGLGLSAEKRTSSDALLGYDNNKVVLSVKSSL